LRWFAAEIVIVVAGVLIALAINAWWQGRQDAARERTYLLQLAEDLRQTEAIMDERDQLMNSLTGGAVERLIRSFGEADRPPPDSVAAWLSNVAYLATPRPVLGTTEALMNAGDFGAIGNDRLVTAITAYYAVNREYLADQERQITRGGDQIREILLAHHDHMGAYRASEYDDTLRMRPRRQPVAEDRTAPFPFDAEAFYQDATTYRRLVYLRGNIRLLERSRAVMRESARTLRTQVEAELNR
jgi:hypothetical protein